MIMEIVMLLEILKLPHSLDHILFTEQFYSYSRNKIWSFKDMKVWNDNVGDELKHTSDHGIIKSTFVR